MSDTIVGEPDPVHLRGCRAALTLRPYPLSCMPNAERYARYRADQTTIWVSKTAAAHLARRPAPNKRPTGAQRAPNGRPTSAQQAPNGRPTRGRLNIRPGARCGALSAAVGRPTDRRCLPPVGTC